MARGIRLLFSTGEAGEQIAWPGQGLWQQKNHQFPYRYGRHQADQQMIKAQICKYRHIRGVLYLFNNSWPRFPGAKRRKNDGNRETYAVWSRIGNSAPGPRAIVARAPCSGVKTAISLSPIKVVAGAMG